VELGVCALEVGFGNDRSNGFLTELKWTSLWFALAGSSLPLLVDEGGFSFLEDDSEM
jgi:hypothetical protein